MVEIEIKCGDLITFLDKCACRGVVLVTEKQKETRNFFNYFYMDCKGDEIVVKAVDSEEGKMYARHYLSGVEVKKEGLYAVTDAQAILDILKSIPKNRKIRFNSPESENFLYIETADKGTYYGYRIRQTVPSDEIELSLKNSKVGVGEWDKIHTIEEGVPKLTLPEGVGFYETVIKFKKSELGKVIKDSVSLTKDQDIKLTSMKVGESWVLQFDSGKQADDVLSFNQFTKEMENPVLFKDKVITNLQPIIPNLFDSITIFFRVAGDKSLKYWVTSKEGNITMNFNSSSV